jgi:hypothetical protein
MSVSVVCVTRNANAVTTHSQLSRAAAELKQRAKAIVGSAYLRDGRVLLPRDRAAAASS